MIELQLGKALAALEKEANALSCADCHFHRAENCSEKLACRASYRADGKDVVFMLIDINQDTGRERVNGFIYRLGVAIKELGERVGHRRRWRAGFAIRLGLAVRWGAARGHAR